MAVSSTALACTTLEAPDDFFGVDAGQALTTSPFDRAGGADAGLDRPSPVAGCLPVRERPERTLGSGVGLEIGGDETWSCDANYVLAGPVFIQPGVTLTVGPDTRILAQAGAYLLAQRGARVVADGTRAAPVVFGSAQAPGQRAPGDWKGLMFAGNAPSHAANSALPGSVSDARAYFGGGPSGSTAHDCGRLRFVRIEFAGGNTDEEATPGAALSLGGCGTATVIDHVQVHRATDGIGLLGGNLSLTHVVVSNTGFGNAIEWTGGFTGNMQFVVARGGAGAALKGSNSAADPTLLPVSHPVIFNATVIGTRPLIPSGNHYGLSLQHGSVATVRNSIIAGFDDGAIALESAQTIGAATPGEISHLTLYDNGADGATHLPRAAAALSGPSLRERNPGLDAATSLERPSFAPTDSGVMSDIALTPPGFDPSATFRGAVAFGSEDWTLEWTDYPLD